MDITITISDAQAIAGEIVSNGKLEALCTKLIVAEEANWIAIASRSSDVILLAKAKAAPKALRDQIDAVIVAVDVARVPDVDVTP